MRIDMKKMFYFILLLLMGNMFNISYSEDLRISELDLQPAKWIWYPCGRTLQNTFVLFRKEIRLSEKVKEAKGWIVADSRYRLFVNGKRVQWGPAPSDPRWQEADPLDLTDYLVQGDNVIAIEVCFFGTGDGTHPMGKPGLLMNLNIDGQELITDDSWSCLLPHSWEPGGYKRWYLRALQESFDARSYPYGWDQVGYKQNQEWVNASVICDVADEPSTCAWGSEYMWEISGDRNISELRRRSVPLMKEYLVENPLLEEFMWIHWKKSPEDYFAMKLPDAFDAIRQTITEPNEKGEYVIYPNGENAAALTFAFQEQGVGWPYFTIDAPEGTVVEMLVHEAHEKGGPAIINSHYNSWSRFICKEGINTFETFDFESFRWIQLHIRNFDRPVKVSSIGMRRRIYPWPVEPKISVSNDTIQKVMDAAVNTLYNCAQETMVDGMARERQQYSGDGSHQLHAVSQILGGKSLPFRFVNTFSQGSSIDGYFMDSWPAWDRLARIIEKQMQLSNWGSILDHSVGFCFDTYHYYMYTGDKAGLKEVYPRLIKFFRYLKSLVDVGEGLVPAENIGVCSVYMDHEAYKKPRHKQLALNLYIAAMCKYALAPLCDSFGETDVKAEVLMFGENIQQACVRKFWDTDKKVYVCNLPWVKEEGEIRYCDRSLSTALIFDMCPNNDVSESLCILEQSPVEMGVSYPCNAVWPLWALIKYHKIERVLSDLKNKWGKMSSVWENNTLQEFWVATPDSWSQWSHCAMYPLIALSQGVAGVYPLEAGSKIVKIEPQLGSLKSIEFDVQTIHGAIHFSAKGKFGKRKLLITLPQDVTAELRLDSREKVKLPLLRQDPDGFKVYKLDSLESYELVLKYT